MIDLDLFFRYLKGYCHGNQFCVVPNFVAWSRSISGSAGPIFSLLHCMVGIELQMINTFYFSQYLKGRCHGNQLKSKNWHFLRTNLICCAATKGLQYWKGLQYCNYNIKILDRMNISTSCAILVTFGPETSEFMLLTIAPFVAIWQKSAYHSKYLWIFWTYHDLLYRFGRRISVDDFPNICFAAAQGTLVWQPVKYGRSLQTSCGTTFTLCFCIQQRIGRS